MYLRQCVGPNDYGKIKDYPKNSCKTFGKEDKVEQPPKKEYKDTVCEVFVTNFTVIPNSRLATLLQQRKEENLKGEICTCSTDGCKPPKKDDYPKPPGPPDSDNPDGHTKKTTSDHATHLSILNYLLILAF